MTDWILKHSAALVVAITLFAILFVVASKAEAYLHTDWACSEHWTATGGTYEFGAAIQDHRRFGGNAQGQAKHMTADNFASKWGGWSAYYRAWPVSWTRVNNDKVVCNIAHEVSWIGVYTVARTEVTGTDDNLHGDVWTMKVTDEWDYTSSTGQFNGNYRGNDWDACSTDPYC